jgi:tripartite-type tricarboxylate transporter receptor subunit TctC
MKKLLFLALALALVAATMGFARGQEEYPARDITNIVVFGAGGGTDTCNRLLMAEMGKLLKVNINVVNVTGASGAIGMKEATGKPADGYTLAGISESITPQQAMGNWDQRVNVWDYFIIGGSPEVVSVTPNSPYKTMKELIDAAKAAPKSIKAGASVNGSIHHLNLLALEKATGASFNFIPYDSSAGSQNAAMTGEISLVITSIAEQAELIKAGKLRALAMLIPQPFEIAGAKVPSAWETVTGLDKYLPINQAIGFAIVKKAPEPVKAKLRDAFSKAMATDNVKKFLTEKLYFISGQSGDEANKVFDKLESTFSWMLFDLGVAKNSPEKFGIPKP